MCTISTGTDCSAAGFQALATQSGSFGCAIVSEWTPVITPPQWDPITNGVQLTVQNGDACPDGTNRGIQVQFTCDPTGGVGPTSFSASEPVTCQYEWQFATSAACGGAPGPTPTPPTPTPPTPTPPGPTPPGPGPPAPGPTPPAPAPAANSPAAIAARNFGCGHISCGWMFLILIPLVAMVAFGIAIPLNKFVIKKDGSWLESIPLSTLLPAFCVNFYWGVRFLLCNCKGKEPVFRRWNCPGSEGTSSMDVDHGDTEQDEAEGYQDASESAGFDDI